MVNDLKFNAAEDILRDPTVSASFKLQSREGGQPAMMVFELAGARPGTGTLQLKLWMGDHQCGRSAGLVAVSRGHIRTTRSPAPNVMTNIC
jgi:hypothetical protein